jgi:hypothetical protein
VEAPQLLLLWPSPVEQGAAVVPWQWDLDVAVFLLFARQLAALVMTVS